MENSTVELLCRLPRAQDLQQLCDLTYQIMGNPVFISDLAHTILAYTRCVEIDDPAWQSIVVGSRVDRKIMAQDRAVSTILGGSAEQCRAIVVEDDFLPYPRIFKTVNDEGRAVGVMVVTAYCRPFRPEDLELAELIASFVLPRMDRGYILSEDAHSLDNYFIRLLDGAQTSGERVRKRLEMLGYAVPSHLYVLSLHAAPGEEACPPEEIGALMRRFRELPGCHAFPYNASIVCLYGTGEEVADWEAQAPELSGLLRRESLIAGVSRSLSDLSQVRAYYRQAQRTEEVGVRLGRSERFFCYDSYASFLLLMEMPRERLWDFCHQKIQDLGAYDDAHDTELCATLQVYLEQAKSLARTAELLYIHRNTVRYRIHKCMELMQTDLEDGNEIFAYILSLRILEYIKKFPSDKEGTIYGKKL